MDVDREWSTFFDWLHYSCRVVIDSLESVHDEGTRTGDIVSESHHITVEQMAKGQADPAKT